MKCYICNRELDKVQFDNRDGRPRPCWTCEAIVTDTILDYDRQTSDDAFIHDLVQPLEEYMEEETSAFD